MQDARVRGALLAVCLACLLGSGLVLLKERQSTTPPIVISAPPPADTPASKPADTGTAPALPKPSARLYVDVSGAVRRPSLYLLPPNSRVMQAVLAAGGPAAGADMDAVNLAQALTDGQKVFVPTRVSTPKVPPTTAASPLASFSAAFSAGVAHARAGKSSTHSNKIAVASGEQVGLNSATVEQLERLPGVGPSMAARIVAYRQQAGGFAKIDDLTLVTGIGPKKLAKIAPFVTLN